MIPLPFIEQVFGAITAVNCTLTTPKKKKKFVPSVHIFELYANNSINLYWSKNLIFITVFFTQLYLNDLQVRVYLSARMRKFSKLMFCRNL